MDSTSSRQRLTDLFAKFGGAKSRVVLPVAPMAAMLAATLVALVILAMPIDSLETLVQESGIATMVTAAAPPLGPTARFAIAFIAALGVGAIVWFGTFLLLGARKLVIKPKRRSTSTRAAEPKPAKPAKRSWFSKRQRDDGVPVLRRADAHPDAPARRPVFANSDLGTPFLDVKADPEQAPFADAVAMPPAKFERDIPQDLDTPLASYLAPVDAPLPEPEPEIAPEAEALPIMAEPPVPEPTAEVAPAPIAPPRFAPHERIETFDLTPLVRPAPEPVVAPEQVAEPAPQPETSRPLASATIHDLLARLEAGVQRRAEAVKAAPEPEPEPAEPSLEDTLAVLRQLASRVG